jgi:hypothetical protein
MTIDFQSCIIEVFYMFLRVITLNFGAHIGGRTLKMSPQGPSALTYLNTFWNC